jgi:hypothetical protein
MVVWQTKRVHENLKGDDRVELSTDLEKKTQWIILARYSRYLSSYYKLVNKFLLLYVCILNMLILVRSWG